MLGKTKMNRKNSQADPREIDRFETLLKDTEQELLEHGVCWKPESFLELIVLLDEVTA